MTHTLRTLSLLFFLPLLALHAQDIRWKTQIKSVGDQVVVRAHIVLDSLRLKRKELVVFTPVLEGKGGETLALRSLVVSSPNQHIYYQRNGLAAYPDALETVRHGGTPQTVDYRESVAYEPWMEGATLRFVTDRCGCGDLAARSGSPAVPLDLHPERKVCVAFLPPVAAPDPVLSLSGKAYLDYPVNRTELHPDFRNNRRELDRIIATIDTVRHNDKVEITGIDIHGYAAPEGPWDNNVRLSQGRAATLRNYVKQLRPLPEEIFTVNYTPEDWDGLDSLLRASDLEHREEILAIVAQRDLDPDLRNEEIHRRFPEQYQYILNTWYPALRHSDYTVSYRVRPLSDEEAAGLLHTQPQLLSLNKMYRIANLYEPGSAAFNEVFAIAVQIYPSDPVANLNAANVALQQFNLNAAAHFLSKADASLPQTVHAQGVLALLEGRYAEARQLLQQADAAGISEAKKNLEILDKLEPSL